MHVHVDIWHPDQFINSTVLVPLTETEILLSTIDDKTFSKTIAINTDSSLISSVCMYTHTMYVLQGLLLGGGGCFHPSIHGIVLGLAFTAIN